MAPSYFVGTSGWSYPHWRGPFYPPGLPQKAWLGFYAQHLSTVELNSPFYRLPMEKAFATWRDSTPEGFLFSVKVSRFITHLKKLRDCQEALETFIARARLLEGKLGPLLYQLPPSLHRNDPLLEEFLALLSPDLTHVFEFRHSSWFCEEVFALLKKFGVSFCIMDLRGLPCPVVATGPAVYVRFHGPSGRYTGCYSEEDLAEWAEKIREVSALAQAVYAYFNNDIDGFAVGNATRLRELLGPPAH